MAYIAMWRSGVVMATTDIPAMDIVAITDIPATMDILLMAGTIEGTVHTTGLIIEAIMDPLMAITPDTIEGFGLAYGSKEKNSFRSAWGWRRQRDVSTPEVSIRM
jgi:hypothetical protein